MQWHDEGIILGTRRHGETSVILETITARHGRHLGLVRGGRSRRMQAVLQAGNQVGLTWRARLDEHLGTFQAEPVALNAARLFDSAVAIYGLQLLAAHLRLLPERDPHDGLYRTVKQVIDHLDEPQAAAELLAQFEVLMLEELGFGLELTSCAATGSAGDLAYVSPKSGRAVSRQAGAPWADRMLALPAFLISDEHGRADNEAIATAFAMTGHFFDRHVWMPRGTGEPAERAGFLAAVARALKPTG
ncbi:MAG: DNA repair protein RecO [Rhizobiaceae bacterium]